MRELISYPVEVPKGLIRVELFEDGNKVKEVKDHNFIASGLINHVFKARIKDLFTQRRVNGGGLVSDAFRDFFKQISLTDANHPEQPENEWFRKGNLIGYAFSDVTYVGNDTQRGTYNTRESYTNKSKVHLVFDFPTHAANGDINSIYFQPDDFIFNVNDFFKQPSLDSARSIKKYGDKYYVLKTNLLEVYSLSWLLIESHSLGDSSIQDFEIVNDTIYYATSVSSGNTKIRKAALSTPISFTNVIVTMKTPAGIAYIDDEEKFVVSDSIGTSTSNSNTYTLNYYDKNFNFIESVSLSIGYGSSTGAIFYENGILFLNTFSVDKEHNINFVISKSPDYNQRIVGLYEDSLVTITGSTAMVLPKVSIGSRSLLATPITKTNKHTMKITYDFILE